MRSEQLEVHATLWLWTGWGEESYCHTSIITAQQQGESGACFVQRQSFGREQAEILLLHVLHCVIGKKYINTKLLMKKIDTKESKCKKFHGHIKKKYFLSCERNQALGFSSREGVESSFLKVKLEMALSNVA